MDDGEVEYLDGPEIVDIDPIEEPLIQIKGLRESSVKICRRINYVPNST